LPDTAPRIDVTVAAAPRVRPDRSGPYRPLRGQDGVLAGVGPQGGAVGGPLEVVVGDEVALAPHAQAFEEPPRPGVARVAPADDSVGAAPGEGLVDGGDRRLRGVSPALVRPVEDVAQLPRPELALGQVDGLFTVEGVVGA